MSSKPPLLRRLAYMLMAHARRVLADRHGFWADGMETEARHITGDWDALCWSTGCVLASYKAIISALPVWTHVIRNILAGSMLYFAYDSLVGPVWALGCYAHFPQSALGFLASLPYDFITCVNWTSVPVVMQMASLIAGALFALSAVQILRRRPSAFWLFVAGSTVALTVFVFEQGVPAYAQYWHSPAAGVVLAHIAVSRAIMPLLVANAVWLFLFRRQLEMR
jgi:hypothetical protein